ncbi:hypothetical protein HZ326_2187 [Fusarium oxysporum f. sp. albedinis]|nr:hypothetical protein HZ326_2187 [Fusarium oxysporum f. sp. albedinis]
MHPTSRDSFFALIAIYGKKSFSLAAQHIRCSFVRTLAIGGFCNDGCMKQLLNRLVDKQHVSTQTRW